MKKWWIFGADFSRFTQSFSRLIRDINGERKKLVIDMSFFTVSFSRFAPPLVIKKRPVRGTDPPVRGTNGPVRGTDPP